MKNKKRIKSSGSILLNQHIDTAFTFFANPSNDPVWRTEINASTLNGTLEVGVEVSEYSFLSKKAPNNLVELLCVQFETNKAAIFETPNGAPFYLRSERQVTAISGNKTAVFYQVEFDLDLVKYAVGFSLPAFIVSFKASSDLKKYLRQLKMVLENKAQKSSNQIV
ncbi:MAG: hypothetical protein CFE24_14305 [Flavobacterium sp. BFFFF2]|nr:MAG: hypothetical protein CFE24_14305 [Flavobacterium sp. BFFFF2]